MTFAAKLPVFMRDFGSWPEPLIRLRHLLPVRGEKGDKTRAAQALLPLAPLVYSPVRS